MNETMKKFGYPASLVHEYKHWVVLLRPKQATLGALVLASKSEATSFSALPVEAFTEFHCAVADAEAALRQKFSYEKINYLMLMMVDPNVHFHVLPRYSKAKDFEGVTFTDPGWPGQPDLGFAPEIRDEIQKRLSAQLQQAWRERE